MGNTTLNWSLGALLRQYAIKLENIFQQFYSFSIMYIDIYRLINYGLIFLNQFINYKSLVIYIFVAVF